MHSSEIPQIAIIFRVGTLLLLAGIFTITDVHARSRIGELKVSGNNGVPCFSITREEQASNGTPLIHSVRVSERMSGRPPVNVWSFYLSQQPPVELSADKCVTYGEAPAGAEVQAAQPLKLWQIYSVGISGNTGEPADSTQAYLGDFCIVPGGSGLPEIVNITRGSRPQGQLTCHDWLPGEPTR